jgi:protein TonB
VQVAAPPPEPTITATTPTPPAPVPFTPVAPPAAAPAPAPPAPVQAGVACSKMVNFAMPTVPASSTVTSGNLIYLATVKDGKITSFEITSIRLEGGNDPKVRRSFIANAEAAVRQYVCSGNAVITQEFVFKLE